MADNLTFMTIPIDWRVPGANVEINPLKSVRKAVANLFRTMLVIGQRLNTGIISAGSIQKITRKEDGVNYFGRGSMIAQQIEAILKVNPFTLLYAIALDDNPAGNAAAGSITFTASPTESGTYYLRIGGRAVSVGVTASQAVAQMATATAAAINADLDGAVTAAAVAGVVTVTSRHKGVEGNSIDIRVNYYQGETTPKGLAATIVAMTGGSGNPDITAVITAMSSLSAYTILCGWTDVANVVILETELATRWGGMQMRQGHMFGYINGTYSSLSAYGSARNSAHSSFFGLNKSPSLPWVNSAQFGAAVEFSGGNDPAIPFKGISLPDVMAPEEKLRFIPTERNLLLHDGISTVTFDQSGACFIEQVVTTYQTNAFNMEDTSLLKLNTKWTADYMAFAFKADILATFPRHKLAGDDVLPRIQPGQKIATPKLIRDCLISTAMKLEKMGLLEDLDQFIEEVQVVRSDADVNRVNAILPPNVVNQFDVFAAAVEYIL
jgi:phage tail sheath gpL-like